MEIKGKRAVVVGGASGMARASAEMLSERGASVAILDLATSAGADVFLTSDLKHHAVSEALEIPGPALCDVAHYATERPWIPVAADLLCRDLGGRVETAVSTERTDPWTWHVGSRAARVQHHAPNPAESSAD